MSRITFIGTSDAFGAGGRRQSAIFVEAPGGGLLLDCAPTTNSGLVALGIARDAVDAVAISHFHADHFAGLPSLLLAAMYEDRRRHPLVIAGPPGVESRVRAAADAIGHAVPSDLPFPLRFVELVAEQRVEVGPAPIRAFPVHHQPDARPHGLDVALGGRRLVYSGDTGWFEALPRQVRGADLFICECTFCDPIVPEHMAYRELVERAPSLGCARVVLTHLGQAMSDQRGRLALETADDGLTIEL